MGEPSTTLVNYEDRLGGDLDWAMEEGSRYFNESSAVHQTLRKVTARLNELGISYAVAGGMALFSHGFRRFTDDVDILIGKDALPEVHDKLDGRGFVRPFFRSKNLRDTDTGVKIEFLIEGRFPGDGKPKEFAFPNPDSVAIEREGIRYLSLPALVELKLASGMSGAGRLKDIADVQELIKLIPLPEDLTGSLNPYVRERYLEVWHDTNRVARRYIKLAKTVAEAEEVLKLLDAAGARGEIIHMQDGQLAVATTDLVAARHFEMWDESEYWPGDE